MRKTSMMTERADPSRAPVILSTDSPTLPRCSLNGRSYSLSQIKQMMANLQSRVRIIDIDIYIYIYICMRNTRLAYILDVRSRIVSTLSS
jgi:hypothetical protein